MKSLLSRLVHAIKFKKSLDQSNVVLNLFNPIHDRPAVFKGFQYTVVEGQALQKRSHTEMPGLIKS